LYDTRHAFVAAYGEDVVRLLDAQSGEKILDVGCGTGDHVAALRARGVVATGLDASPDMVRRASAKYPGLPVEVGDVRQLAADASHDAVFSNAVLHWVPQADEAAAAIYGALRPGGRFIAEFGGSGNVAAIVDGVATVRERWGLAAASSPWYYPTVGEYAAVLERTGFEVRQAYLFDRPTRLDGDHGLTAWLRMFGEALLTAVSDRDAFLSDVEAVLRPRLWRDGTWWADYRRLRVQAVKTS
jgi:trans-aconitate methyltransferase